MKPSGRQLDALSELMNIGVGRAAGMLNEMLGSPIELVVPSVKICRISQLTSELGHAGGDGTYAFVRLPFRGTIHGTAALVFPPDSAAQLVAALTGEEPGTPDLDTVRAGTLSEVGNIVINGVMGSLGNLLEMPLTYELPTYFEGSPDHLVASRISAPDPTMLLAHTRFAVQDLEIKGTILLVFEVRSFGSLLGAVDRVDSSN
ncbi:MAG: chemotaxis protein CheC [bacterium]|nr:chemotaxis protein CheC [bacterium]